MKNCSFGVKQQSLSSSTYVTFLKLICFWISGSDEVAPATSFFTTDRDGAVKLRMGTKEYQAEKPITVISVFKKTVERVPNNLALGKLYQILAHAIQKGYCYHFVSVYL